MPPGVNPSLALDLRATLGSMGNASDSLERGLGLFGELLAEDPRLEREFAESRSHFATKHPPGSEEQRLAARRHLEWFVLERPSETLGGVPVEALQDTWLERADAGQRALGPAFLESLAGAFEVTQAVPEEGVWVRDLFSLGEFPVDEPEAATELQQGDVVVGRLFPIGEGVFRFSPAAACFRDARLLEAVREDLDRMRQARRGVLRVQQIELEQLFFQSGDERPSVPSPAEVREHARALLEAGGLDRARTDGVLHAIERASERGDGSVVTEILNELAFETELELEGARSVLVELWTSLAQSAPDAQGAEVQDARAALAAFDRGRAAGQDLEQLFRALESDLGVATAAELEDEAEGSAAELPVIAGLVEEFLWDVGREEGPAAAERWSGLRRLGGYARAISVFEDLGPRELLDFAGRWLLDEGDLRDPAQASDVLDALAEFCRWSEANHEHALWRDFGADLDRLRASVPRLLALRLLLPDASSASGAPLLRIGRLDPDAVWLEQPDGEATRHTLPQHILEHLREGDFVRLSDASGRARLTSVYPREIEGLLPTEPTER